MKLLSWNCRGLGGPFTISQLKDTVRLYLPDITFICEIKQKKGFVSSVCKRLRCRDRWDIVEPSGRKKRTIDFLEWEYAGVSDYKIRFLY